MAEVILLAVKKIGIALGNEAINQAISRFGKFVTKLTELQGSMGRTRRELRLIHEFLCRMDVCNLNNQAYEIWVEELRVLVLGIEDIVDEYLHLVGRKHDAGCGTYLKKGFKRPNVLLSLTRIASAVKEAQDNLVHLFQAKDRWVLLASGGNASDSSSSIVERSQHLATTSRSISDEDLVGVDDKRRELTERLEADELERSVIVLDGMGGLGKTALASNVYKKAKEKFECHAWVSISQTYSRKDVLRELIEKLFKCKGKVVPTDIATMDLAHLEGTLRRFLEQQKYLIVLDDVWTQEAFNDFSGALICNDKGSRLVITTREGDVARLDSQGHGLTLKSLPEEKSWDLFCKMAFPRTNHECPTELKTLSKEIVSKCKGLPLAVVSVGSLLCAREKTVEEWTRINDQLSWELINNPLLDHVKNVLHLSFIYLPAYLKSCFLYCSLFPEDYLLKRKMLIRLWIAEGFIERRGRSTLEEVAEGYIKELIRRNMLQLIDRNTVGRIKSFRMHDIVRELAVDLCRRECFGVAYNEDKYWESLEEKDERRLAIHKLTKVIHLHRLRSVIALDKSMPLTPLLRLTLENSRYMSVLELSGLPIKKIPHACMPCMPLPPLLRLTLALSKKKLRLTLENSRYMSVLELSGLPIKKIPHAIGDLFNLRHLGLRGSNVKLLPKSIEKLSNLLTLDLSKSDIQKLPGGIVKLKKLRHFFAEKVKDPYGRVFRWRTGVCIPKGISNLTNLQTLQVLKAQHDSIKHLGELRQLRTFRILNVKQTYCKDLCKSLVQMQFLYFLSITASDKNEVLQLNGLNPLPPNLQKLRLRGRLEESSLFGTTEQNLNSLRLFWSQLREDPLPRLSQLSNLTELCFMRAYSGDQLIFRRGWFPNLKVLYLADLPNLKHLKIEEGAMASLEEGAMASLESLTLLNLSSMTEVPHGIEFLEPLKYLGFLQITPEFLTLLVESNIENYLFDLRD